MTAQFKVNQDGGVGWSNAGRGDLEGLGGEGQVMFMGALERSGGLVGSVGGDGVQEGLAGSGG